MDARFRAWTWVGPSTLPDKRRSSGGTAETWLKFTQAEAVLTGTDTPAGAQTR